MTDQLSPSPMMVADCQCHTGEGPLWHPDERVVYWTDIPQGQLFCYDPKSGNYEQVLDYDGAIGGFTIQTDGRLLLFLDKGTIRPWSADTGLGAPVVEIIPAERDSRFNDVLAGPQGRVYCGTMPTTNHGGRLYRLDTDGTLTLLRDNIAIPNGLGFTPDRQQLYFTETEADRIYRFDYNHLTGELSNQEVFVDTADEAGRPDGLTVDANGHVWSAFWNGGCLIRYAPNGTEQQRIEFPARKVSSITFGDSNSTAAYVTTALGPGKGSVGTRAEEGEGAGALYRFHPDINGLPVFRSNVGL